MERKRTNRFRKAVKIKRSGEISLLIKKGRRWESDSFRVYHLENGLKRDRLAVLVPRKCGTAVCRNRIKRTVRETIRNESSQTQQRCDILVRFFPKRSAGKTHDLESSLKQWYQEQKK